MGIKAGNLESDVTSVCIQYLEMVGWPKPIRVNSGKVPVVQGGRTRWVRLAPAGTSDWIGIVPGSGRILCLEFKRPKGGKVSEAQSAFLSRVIESGGVGLIPNGLDVIERAVRHLTLDPNARLRTDGTLSGQ